MLVALKLETAFVPFKVRPPTEEVVNNAPLIKPAPLSLIAPVDVNDTLLLAPAAIEPVMLIAPVLLTLTLPLPDCEIPVMVNGAAVFTNDTAPPLVFVPLNVVTVFALPSVVPPTEQLLTLPPLIVPAPASFTTPFVPVRLTLPVVLILPALIVTLVPAVKLITPEPLLTFALTLMLPLPELVKLILLLPVVLMPFTVPKSSVKLATVNVLLAALVMEIGPLTLAAMLLKTLLVVNITLEASRKIKPVLLAAKLIAAFCVIVPAVSKVNTPLVPKVAVVMKLPRLILPEVLVPMRTLVARISFRVPWVNCSVPVPPAYQC